MGVPTLIGWGRGQGHRPGPPTRTVASHHTALVLVHICVRRGRRQGIDARAAGRGEKEEGGRGSTEKENRPRPSPLRQGLADSLLRFSGERWGGAGVWCAN